MWDSKHCALCGENAAFREGSLGPLLGPVGENRTTGEGTFVHRLCALWSPEVYQTDEGTLRNVLAAVKRSRSLKCSACSRKGATLGCRVERCMHSYHLHCAKAAGCMFYPSKYVLACPVHALNFKHEADQHRNFPQSPYTPHRRRSRPARRHLHPQPQPVGSQKRPRECDDMEAYVAAVRGAARGARMQARAEAEMSSDDEQHFHKKERKRLARDCAKLNPVILGRRRVHVEETAAPSEDLAQPQPVEIAEGGWESVGGHGGVIKQLKEMVVLPLTYPELFTHMGIIPPRGILFHGEPGTGKTLVARALAGACARQLSHPVAFFARKGADCLGKFSGEAERTLRLLFEEAQRREPAIVFLDELDALVPARSVRAGASDQVYASVVSTLLALMDGITDRGQVIVIGATNRPDAIDPALRRPGRFDREVYFGLPSAADRAAILKVHTSKWKDPPSEPMIQSIAAATEGFAGADLQALCTCVVMAAVHRAAPLLMQDLDRRIQQGTSQPPLAARPSKCSDSMPEPVVASPRKAADEAGPLCRRPHEDATAMPPEALGEAPDAGGHGLSHPQGGADSAVQEAIGSIKVRPADWRAALSSAPQPCSRRQGLAAIAAEHAALLPHHLAPLLLPALLPALQSLAASCLPLPPLAAQAVQCLGTQAAAMEEVLQQLGAVAAPPGKAHAESAPQASDAGDQAAHQPRGQPSYPQCRLLVSSEGDCGQQHVAGALSQLLQGAGLNVINLPALIVEGGGDATEGCLKLVQEALRRASPSSPCVFYLPRLETWALNSSVLEVVKGQEDSAANAAAAAAPATPAHALHCQRTPAYAASMAAMSPFTGMLSAEERHHDTPAGAWSCLPSCAAGQSARPFSSANKHHKASTLPSPIKPTRLSLGSTSSSQHSAYGGVELIVLSEVWSLFEQMLKQAPSTQPIIVLGTCHSPQDSLPDSLVSFFAGSSGISSHAAQGQLPSRVIVLDTPGQPAWEGAARRALETVVASVSEAVAARLQQALAQHTAGPDCVAASSGTQQAGGASRDVKGAADAPEPVSQVPHHGLEGLQQQCNAAELDTALKLQRQVSAVISRCGHLLLKDPRSRVAKARSRVAGRSGPTHVQHWSIADVANRAQRGKFHSLDSFQGAISSTAANIQAAVSNVCFGSRYAAAAAAASALHDEVSNVCFSIAQQLQLQEEEARRLLGIAKQQRDLVQQLTTAPESQLRAQHTFAAGTASDAPFADPHSEAAALPDLTPLPRAQDQRSASLPGRLVATTGQPTAAAADKQQADARRVQDADLQHFKVLFHKGLKDDLVQNLLPKWAHQRERSVQVLNELMVTAVSAGTTVVERAVPELSVSRLIKPCAAMIQTLQGLTDAVVAAMLSKLTTL